MSLTVVSHPDLHTLADHFAAKIRTRPEGTDLMTPEFVIVQTPGMKKWLALETARRNSVFTQVKMLMPRQCIMNVGYRLLGTKEKRSAFEQDVLPWALFRLITEGLESRVPELGQIQSYAGSLERESKLFAFSQQVAEIFDQYMLYRPDWLERWEADERVFPRNDAEVWQKYLWNTLVSNHEVGGVLSSSKFNKILIERLRSAGESDRTRLPRRIFLFGMAILPPQYLSIFSELGRLIDVTMYLHVPSIYYYGDLESDRRIQMKLRSLGGSKLRESVVPVGNRLLANLGKMGREFMDLILEKNPAQEELYDFVAAEDAAQNPDSLLAMLQRDVLLCRDPAPEPIVCKERDWSVRLAACHGPLREVEVLHDLLLDSFASDKSLSPSDVLVVTPDIEQYGPLVSMVFGDAKQRCGVSIPYTIADQSQLAEDIVARFVQDILTAVSGRFEASAILPLFETASELAGIPISSQQRESLARWCRNSGVRWGYDGEFKKALELPPTDEFSWRYGIDRLLAGYAFPDEEKIEPGFFPAVEVEGQSASLLGRLADFVDALASVARESGTPHTVEQWNALLAPMFREILSAEAEPEDTENAASRAFSGALAVLRERAVISGAHRHKVPFSIFMDSLIGELNAGGSGRGFVSGSVTVARMIPMRSIPFRIVAMIGMKRGAFPRHTERPKFDLIGQEFARKGDRDSLKSDRYVFLETILAARQKMIVTWTGFDTGDGRVVPPSVLVDELRNHMNREYALVDESGVPGKAGDRCVVEYPLHPFSSRYASTVPNDSPLSTWNTKWFVPGEPVPPAKDLFLWKVKIEEQETTVIDGNRIVRTLSDPLTSFLVDGCRIARNKNEEGIEDEERFEMNRLDDWKLRDAVLRDTLGITSDGVEKLVASGFVPPGATGNVSVAAMRDEVQATYLKNDIVAESGSFASHQIAVEVRGRMYTTSIPIASVSKNKAVMLEAGKLNAKRLLSFWISHVFLNLEGSRTSTGITSDKHVEFIPVSSAEAEKALLALSALADRARGELLPTLLEPTLEFMKELTDLEKARKKGWDELKKYVDPHTYSGSYHYDPHWDDAFGHAERWEDAMKCVPGGEPAFIALAKQIFGLMLERKGA
jgi:exodeoxyribonuclease V gamma subunit